MRHYKWERALRRTQVTVRWWRGRQIGFPDVFDEGESTVVGIKTRLVVFALGILLFGILRYVNV